MSTIDQYILAVDLGTSGAKVGLFTTFGEVVSWETEPVPLYLLPNGGAEQDAEDWWRGIITAAQRVLAHSPVPTDQVIAVCTSTHGYGLVPVDREGNGLMRAMLW